MRGHLGIIKLLINRGANPLLKDVAGWSAFHYAAGASWSEVVEFLISLELNPFELGGYVSFFLLFLFFSPSLCLAKPEA